MPATVDNVLITAKRMFVTTYLPFPLYKAINSKFGTQITI